MGESPLSLCRVFTDPRICLKARRPKCVLEVVMRKRHTAFVIAFLALSILNVAGQTRNNGEAELAAVKQLETLNGDLMGSHQANANESPAHSENCSIKSAVSNCSKTS